VKGKSMILMEWMCGDLRTLIDKKCQDGTPPFPQLVALDVISQIAVGMAYLHDRGVFHGDLKASNVLVSRDCGPIEVKISDFGVSQCLQLTRDCEACLHKHGDVCPSCNLSVYIIHWYSMEKLGQLVAWHWKYCVISKWVPV
jgi:serine/threonine protein kinase